MTERILQVVRLSRRADDTTSPERQRQIGAQVAATRSGRIVGVAEDLDVSGTVSPFARPELGEWLARPRDYDTILVWRLDRIVRRAEHLSALITWAKRYDLNIVSATESFDLKTPAGEMMAYIIALCAGFELSAIQERNASTRAFLRNAGRYGGGSYALGYRPAKLGDGEGTTLAIDPETHAILTEAVERVISGDSIAEVCRDFQARAILSPSDWRRVHGGRKPKETRWNHTQLSSLLRSEALLGYQMHGGKAMRGDDGMPRAAFPPLVDLDTWQRLQAAIDGNTTRPAGQRRQDAHPLLGVVLCAECERPLHQGISKGARRYTCNTRTHTAGHIDCPGVSVTADRIDEWVYEEFRRRYGRMPVTRVVEMAGVDYRGEIAEVERALGDLEEDRYVRGAFPGEAGAKRFAEMQAKLTERLEALQAQPTREAEILREETGEMYGELWDRRLDAQGKRQRMLDAGVRVLVSRATKRTGRIFDTSRLEMVVWEDPATAAVADDD